MGNYEVKIGSFGVEDIRLIHRKNTKAIDAYISNQLREDNLNEQLTLERVDPFTGSR